MNRDAEIRERGMQALIAALGPVDSARFVSLALREPFDYVKWREEHFANETIDSLMEKMIAFEKERDSVESVS